MPFSDAFNQPEHSEVLLLVMQQRTASAARGRPHEQQQEATKRRQMQQHPTACRSSIQRHTVVSPANSKKGFNRFWNPFRTACPQVAAQESMAAEPAVTTACSQDSKQLQMHAQQQEPQQLRSAIPHEDSEEDPQSAET